MISTTKTNFDLLQDRGSAVVMRLKNEMSVFEVENDDDTLRLQNIIVEGVPFTMKNIRDIDNIKQVNANTYGYYSQDPDPIKKFYVLLKNTVNIIPRSARSFFRENANTDPDEKKFRFTTSNIDSNFMLSKNDIEEKLIVERVEAGGSRRSKKYLDRSKTKKSKMITARRALLKKRK